MAVIIQIINFQLTNSSVSFKFVLKIDTIKDSSQTMFRYTL